MGHLRRALSVDFVSTLRGTFVANRQSLAAVSQNSSLRNANGRHGRIEGVIDRSGTSRKAVRRVAISSAEFERLALLQDRPY
jgi:hypothetical protein